MWRQPTTKFKEDYTSTFLEELSYICFHPLSGENRWLVTDEPVEFEELPVEVETSGELPMVLEESIEDYASK